MYVAVAIKDRRKGDWRYEVISVSKQTRNGLETKLIADGEVSGWRRDYLLSKFQIP